MYTFAWRYIYVWDLTHVCIIKYCVILIVETKENKYLNICTMDKNNTAPSKYTNDNFAVTANIIHSIDK